MLTLSYLQQLRARSQAARRRPGIAGCLRRSATAAPSLGDLQALDQLRLTIVQLDGYQQNGPPWSYRFGLYQGDKLAARARRIYFDRFRPMLLNPTQANLVSYLRGLPNAPAPGADYTAAYNPLKAYLITTSNPDKSAPQFLTPVFLQYWLNPGLSIPRSPNLLGNRSISMPASFFARTLTPSLRIPPRWITRAPIFLTLALCRAYTRTCSRRRQKASPAIDFNRQYPNSAASVVEPHVVPGEFTRSGFAFMQDAVRHPDRYFQGETWVLGDQAARSLDTASVSKQLTAIYSGDFIKQWHAFLTEAHVVSCGSLHEAPEKLNALAGPESPMLEFFYTVSSNTAVADPQIKAIFQPAQVLVDPNATARFIGPGNTNYVNALLSLSGAVNQFNQNPDTSRDQLNAAAVGGGFGGTADRAGL